MFLSFLAWFHEFTLSESIKLRLKCQNVDYPVWTTVPPTLRQLASEKPFHYVYIYTCHVTLIKLFQNILHQLESWVHTNIVHVTSSLPSTDNSTTTYKRQEWSIPSKSFRNTLQLVSGSTQEPDLEQLPFMTVHMFTLSRGRGAEI